MKLKKNIKINIYEVIADYKVKTENSPFIAILQFAEENGGKVDSYTLQSGLLAPLSEKACGNLLKRLAKMGYFEKIKTIGKIDLSSLNMGTRRTQTVIQPTSKDFYRLTELGYESAQKNEFYEQRNGLLKLYVAEGFNFIEQKIVKIKEYNYDPDKHKLPNNMVSNLEKLQDSQNIIKLKNDSFILDKFEPKCKILDNETEQLTLNANKDNSIIKILDFEDIENYTKQDIVELLLKNKYKNNYLPDYQILKVDFDENNLQFQRNIEIDKPQINTTIFNSITIPNIKVSPKIYNDAELWHSALLKQQINKYFLSDKEFVEFSNKIADKFELYASQLQNITTRDEFANKLNDKTDFYKKAKLETINYLSY